MAIKGEITRLFNVNHTRIKGHAEDAKRMSKTFRWIGFALATAGIILAIYNLMIYYTDIVGNSGTVTAPTAPLTAE